MSDTFKQAQIQRKIEQARHMIERYELQRQDIDFEIAQQKAVIDYYTQQLTNEEEED